MTKKLECPEVTPCSGPYVKVQLLTNQSADVPAACTYMAHFASAGPQQHGHTSFIMLL